MKTTTAWLDLALVFILFAYFVLKRLSVRTALQFLIKSLICFHLCFSNLYIAYLLPFAISVVISYPSSRKSDILAPSRKQPYSFNASSGVILPYSFKWFNTACFWLGNPLKLTWVFVAPLWAAFLFVIVFAFLVVIPTVCIRKHKRKINEYSFFRC